jgi:hypothetical protein
MAFPTTTPLLPLFLPVVLPIPPGARSGQQTHCRMDREEEALDDQRAAFHAPHTEGV